MSILSKLVKEDFGYRASGNWGRSQDHSSLVVDERKDTFYWNAKDMYGGPAEYLVRVRGLTRAEAREYLKSYSNTPSVNTFIKTYAPYEKLVDFLWLNGKSNRDYWYKRCLEDNTIDRFRLGFYEDWYTLPIYYAGNLHNIQTRQELPEKQIKSWYRGKLPALTNSDILKIVSKVYITEGTVDSILLSQYGVPSVSHNGGSDYWSDKWMKEFIRTKEIIYIADNDDAGIVAAKKVARSLGEYRVKIYRFKDKEEKFDTIDFFRNGGTLEEFNERIKESKFLYQGI